MPNQSKTFSVPQAVRDAAKRGLELRKEHGRGGLDTRQAKKEGVGSGVQRASNLIQGKVSYATVKRMLAFFRRHEVYKREGHHKDRSSASYISWLIWGGDAGYSWAKRIVKQEEKVEKGSFLAMTLFGDDFPEDEAPEVMEEAAPTSFSDLLKATKRKKDFMDLEGRKRIEAEVDEETDVTDADVDPAPVPKDAIQPEEEPLSDKELEAALEEFGTEDDDEEVEKGVITIDLVGGDEEELPDTDPAPPVPPPMVPQPIAPEPMLQEIDIDFVPNVIVSPYDHVKLKKIAKKGRKLHGVERAAKKQGLYIMRGQWADVDLDLVQGYLSFIDEPEMKKNALAVGGEAMLAVIEKAEPKVPEKYLTGLTGEKRAKRKREIQRRMKDKQSYKPLPGDKDAKTKPSKYTRSSFAAKVREEVKSPGKDEFLRAAAKVSGIRRSILEDVYDRGLKAHATGGHRPGATPQAWAKARVYSFCTGGKTRSTADKDLWEKHKNG